MVAALAIGAVTLLAMLCVSWYDWVILPTDALVPIHFGIGDNRFVPKRFGLVMHPAVGVWSCWASLIGSLEPGKATDAPPGVGLPAAMFIMLVVQVGAIRVAGRRSGG